MLSIPKLTLKFFNVILDITEFFLNKYLIINNGGFSVIIKKGPWLRTKL